VSSIRGAVIAVAGRRIDAEPAPTPRFPFDQVERVGRTIAGHLREVDVVALVCSAACGADLIALGIAEDMRLRTRIILPFALRRFRETSVVDRPRPEFWGRIFDRVTDAARARGDLVELDFAEGDDTAYSTTNVVIIDEAKKLAAASDHGPAGGPPVLLALVVWEGASRGSDDNTHAFAELAKDGGFRIQPVLTLDAATQHAPQ
jgi:hypothetical protein